MPGVIKAYKCTNKNCIAEGNVITVRQKMSEPLLTKCEVCDQETLERVIQPTMLGSTGYCPSSPSLKNF